MRKSWLAAICVAAGAGAVGFHGAVWADDSLDATVRNFAIDSVTRMMWLKQGDDYWAYYSIPPNQFTPVLGQNSPVQRFVEARDVTFVVRSQPLTEADRLNGLQWQGSVTMVAEAAREYSCDGGWQPWVSRPTLMIDYPIMRNNQVSGRYQITMQVPANTTFQQPYPDELPAADAPAHASKLCLPQTPPPTLPEPAPNTSGCGIHHLPNGMITGRACY